MTVNQSIPLTKSGVVLLHLVALVLNRKPEYISLTYFKLKNMLHLSDAQRLAQNNLRFDIRRKSETHCGAGSSCTEQTS